MNTHIKRTPARALGTKIQELRVRRQLSQGELAQRSQLHASNFGRIERGLANPNIETLARIAKALDSSVSEITEYITAPTPRAPHTHSPSRQGPGSSRSAAHGTVHSAAYSAAYSAIGHSNSNPSG